MNFKEGEKVGVQTKDHKRNSKGKNICILSTREGYFLGFHGEKSVKIRFFPRNGTHVDKVALIERVKPWTPPISEPGKEPA